MIQRFIILALTLLLIAGGVLAWTRLPIEAYPDVADVEVDVITLWPGHAAEEVERLVTIALEKELNGIANVTFLRSFSNFGLSNIRVLFADGTDNYWARPQVLERIAQADLPPDAKPQLGPLASVIGEVYRYTLESRTLPLVELKALQDWVLEREFRTLKEVFDSVGANNSSAGGSYLRQGEYTLMVRGIGQVRTGSSIRFGVLGRDNEDDLLQGIVLMRKGENPDAVVKGVRDNIHDLKKLLPEAVVAPSAPRPTPRLVLLPSHGRGSAVAH